jgi:imidazolonepropionase-like amidohydrolase
MSSFASTLLVRATIYTGTGLIFTDGLLVAKDGLINYAGEYSDAELLKYDTSSSEITYLDKRGKHLYPGLIALNTTLGITEIDLVRATHDFQEAGQNNADVRSIIAYNTDSKVVPTVRSNGIMIAEIAPAGGLIAGQSSLVYTTGHNWEGVAIKTDCALHLNWPSKVQHRGWWAEQENSSSSKNAEELLILQDIFHKAHQAYTHKLKPSDAKTKALLPLFSGERKLLVHANAASDILDAVAYFKGLGISPVIIGGMESYKILSFLKKEEVSIILVRTHSLPTYSHWDIHLPYMLPCMLADSGIQFAITDESHWQQRNLAFQAGTAIAYGLSPEAALMSISLVPARILGIDKILGSLEIGKSACFIISSGDLFDMNTSLVEDAYIKGKKISLDDKQKQLYDQYRMLYFDK